jgi:hypothetical protein
MHRNDKIRGPGIDFAKQDARVIACFRYENAARHFLMLKIAGGGFMGRPVACYRVLKAGGIPL